MKKFLLLMVMITTLNTSCKKDVEVDNKCGTITKKSSYVENTTGIPDLEKSYVILTVEFSSGTEEIKILLKHWDVYYQTGDTYCKK